MLSITTDYARDQGCPEQDLRKIAQAGFSHIHWCHHWNTDFLYSKSEIDQIDQWMKDLGLTLTDLHGSDGQEKRWTSLREYERQAGVELVKNRIDMVSQLRSDVVIMHIGSEPQDMADRRTYWDHLWASLDEIEPFARERGVRIAIENGVFAAIRKVFERYAPDTVGLCYDCGHGNLIPDGLDEVESLKARLISIHLHDNDGTSDQHKLLFSGTVNWDRLAGILAASAYEKPVSMEVSMKCHRNEEEESFLRTAFKTGKALTEKIEKAS